MMVSQILKKPKSLNIERLKAYFSSNKKIYSSHRKGSFKARNKFGKTETFIKYHYSSAQIQ